MNFHRLQTQKFIAGIYSTELNAPPELWGLSEPFQGLASDVLPKLLLLSCRSRLGATIVMPSRYHSRQSTFQKIQNKE